MKSNMSKLEWFGNDADGLSMIDFITVFMFIYFLTIKTIHFYVAIKYANSPATMENTTLVMSEINKFTDMIIMFYFGKKTIDTTITKVGLFKSNQYENRNTIDVPVGSDVLTKNDKKKLQDIVKNSKLDKKDQYTSHPIEIDKNDEIEKFNDSITKEMVTIRNDLNIENTINTSENTIINTDIVKPEITDEIIENLNVDEKENNIEVADIDIV